MSEDDNVFEFTHFADRLTPGDPPGPLPPAWEPPEGKTTREWCEEPDPPLVEILGPMITESSRVVVGGDSGHGKTTLVMQMIHAVATGGEFLGMTGCGGKIMVIDLEQGRRTMKRRMREARLDTTDNVMYFSAPDGMDLLTTEQVNWIDETVADGLGREPYRMVLLDPLYKAHQGDSNDERAMVDLMRRLDRLRARHGFALVIPMHLRKVDALQKEPKMNDIFGSGGVVRGAEVVLGIQKLGPESTHDARLFFWKDRDGDLQELAGGDHWNLMFDRTQGFRRGADDLPSRMTSPQKIMLYLTEAGIPMDKNAIVNGTQLAMKTVDGWLPQMVNTGQIVELPHRGPQGRKMYAMPDNSVVIRADGETTVHGLSASIEQMGDD